MHINIDNNRYQKMPYHKVGNSGLYLPAISLGLWHNFGEEKPFDEARRMVLTAFNHGVTHFDLANNYGNPPGSAEKTFGKILSEDLNEHRNELIISTKAGFRMWDGPYGEGSSRKYLLSSLDDSLKRMNLDYVDIFYSHRYDEHTPLEETMSALSDAVKLGKALYIGLSNYPYDKLKEAIDILKDLGTPPILYQGKFNIIDQTIKETNILELCMKEGIGIIPFSPLHQGVLTDKYLEGIPEDSRMRMAGTITEDEWKQLQDKVSLLDTVANKEDMALSEMALRYVLSTPNIPSAIVGVSSIEQLNKNLDVAKRPRLEKPLKERIEAIIK